MPKRLTADELGDSGPMNPDFQQRKLLIEVTISYPGSVITDVFIAGNVYQIANSGLRRAAIEAEMKEPALPKAHKPVAYLRDVDGTGSMHVCAKGDPGATPVYTV